MALKSSGKDKPTAAPVAEAEFEEMEVTGQGDDTTAAAAADTDTTTGDNATDEGTVIEGEVVTDTTTAAPSEAEAAAATKAATGTGEESLAERTEVATQKTGGALSNLKGVGLNYAGPAFEGLKNNFEPGTIDWNTFPRIKVNLEGFQDEDEDLVGKKMVFELMSFNDRWVVTTGVEGKEDLAKFSIDGKTIDGTGQPIPEYIAYLKSEGFNDSESKKYLDVYGMLIGTAKTDDGEIKAIDLEDQEIICLQVPPMSVAKFNRLRINEGVRMSRTGRTDEKLVILVTQEKVKGSKNTFAQIDFQTYVVPEADKPEA